MNLSAHPDPRQLLPHRSPMLMIDQVHACDSEWVRCSGRIEPDNPLLQDGLFPSYSAVELLAQACGILLGVRGGVIGQPRPGAIAQIKQFKASDRAVPVGSLLEIEANYNGGNASVALFDGQVMLEQQLLLKATLMIALLPEVS